MNDPQTKTAGRDVTDGGNSDELLLDLLRRRGSLSVADIAQATSVTATAVRQRLNRLMAQGLVRRELDRRGTEPAGRGRPSHRYLLTEKARRQAGTNFADLAIALWRELRSVRDPEVRRGLLARLADSLADQYQGQVQGNTVSQRLESVAELFGERRIPLEIIPAEDGGLPVLEVHDCPYPELAEQDRGVCAMEKMLLSRLLEEDVSLSQCRLDGHACCQFQTA